MVILIPLVLVLIFFLQGMPLVREGTWRELVVFLLLLSLSGYLMYGQVLDFFVPNPADFIRFLTQRVPGTNLFNY